MLLQLFQFDHTPPPGHKNGTLEGARIDLLTPSLSTREGLRPRLNVQRVAHAFYWLFVLGCAAGTVGEYLP